MQKIQVPLFPLNGVIFFPNSQLPLNIFEERYIQMIDFSLSTNRMIGMIQSDKNKKPYKIGCVGKITSFYESVDGGYIINLIGKNYFSIIEELPKTKKFRIAKVELETNTNILEKNILKNFNKNMFLSQYKNFINKLNIDIDFKLIQKIEDEELIKFVAMSSPFSTADKQMLLETYDINQLSVKIISLFDFYSRASSKSIN